MSSPLVPYLARSYAEVKQQYPQEGRRRWRLRIAQQFWTAVGERDLLRSQDVSPEVEFDTDPDPLDGVTRNVPALGLIVRTDFSDEASWAVFCDRLQDSEKELISDSGDVDENQPLQSDNANESEDSSDSESEDEDGPPAIFHVVNPSSPQERALLTNASNLTVLRLFNDVDIRPSPVPPPGVKRVNPQNRLVDKHGWQEYYRGKQVWVYDTRSNTDQCVRAINQSGDMYGTATGDSWRARVSHVCEIQVNLSSGTIKVDFGGLDRWNFVERSRNMLEAEM